MPDNLISINQAAAIMGVNHRTIRQLIKAQTLPCVRLGYKLIRIKVSDLDALIKRGVEVNEEILQHRAEHIQQAKAAKPTTTTTETTATCVTT